MLDEWKQSCSALLVRFRNSDWGYEIGENRLNEPADIRVLEELKAVTPPELLEFYFVADGLSWPDVHTGVFIHRAARVLASANKGDPVLLERDSTPITVFGSDGGGGLFAISKSNGNVLHLGAGKVTDGVYFGRNFKVVANTLLDFLLTLQRDLERVLER